MWSDLPAGESPLLCRGNASTVRTSDIARLPGWPTRPASREFLVEPLPRPVEVRGLRPGGCSFPPPARRPGPVRSGHRPPARCGRPGSYFVRQLGAFQLQVEKGRSQLLQQRGIVRGPHLGDDPRRRVCGLRFQRLDPLLDGALRRLRFPHLGFEVAQPAERDVLFDVGRDEVVSPAEIRQLSLGLGESLPILLGLLLEEVERSRRPVNREMLFEVQAGERLENLRGLMRILRSVADGDHFRFRDGFDLEALPERSHGLGNALVHRLLGRGGFAARPTPRGTFDRDVQAARDDDLFQQVAAPQQLDLGIEILLGDVPHDCLSAGLRAYDRIRALALDQDLHARLVLLRQDADD